MSHSNPTHDHSIYTAISIRNQRTSPLLKLPPELRLAIFTLALRSFKFHLTDSGGNTISLRQTNTKTYTSYAALAQALYAHSTLWTTACRQLRKDTHRLHLSAMTTLEIKLPRDEEAVAKHLLFTIKGRHATRQLRLIINNHDLVRTGRNQYRPGKALLRTLKMALSKLKGLKWIMLVYQGPVMTTWSEFRDGVVKEVQGVVKREKKYSWARRRVDMEVFS